MIDIAFALWLIFIPFGAASVQAVRIDPPYENEAACEAAREELIPKLADMWPDTKANVKRIEVQCHQMQKRTET